MSSSSSGKPNEKKRFLYIDWMRGWAVLFMFEAHAYSAWLRGDIEKNTAYHISKIIAGYAAPLFLFLAGIGMAMALDRGLSQKQEWAQTQRLALRRGLQIFLAALAFRLQNHLLGGGDPANLLRVDILNCIGVSMMISAAILWPKPEEKWGKRAMIGSVAIIMLSPWVANIVWPSWTPWFLTSYISDRREWFFPLFPWACYLFAGLFFGVWWGRNPDYQQGKMNRTIWLSLLIGLMAIMGSMVQQWSNFSIKMMFMGGISRNQSTYLFTHMGWILVFMFVCYVIQKIARPRRFGPIRQIGSTSLLMYWVHIELVYGHMCGSRLLNLKGHLSFLQASLALFILTIIMIALSWARTHYFKAFRPGVLFEKIWSVSTEYIRASWRIPKRES